MWLPCCPQLQIQQPSQLLRLLPVTNLQKGKTCKVSFFQMFHCNLTPLSFQASLETFCVTSVPLQSTSSTIILKVSLRKSWPSEWSMRGSLKSRRPTCLSACPSAADTTQQLNEETLLSKMLQTRTDMCSISYLHEDWSTFAMFTVLISQQISATLV